MPLQLRSRPTTDSVRARSPSPFATPAMKQQIPTICLTTATPADANTPSTSSVAPWTTEPAPAPIAPKPTANGEPSRRRLVPKKSKLSLLGASAKARDQDFSDVVRRVGGGSVKNSNDGFEIYVDAADDPELGEILMVKKKKSRAALNGMQWGALGEVTNVPTTMKAEKEKVKGGKRESLLKVKTDENQKWWSIGRGRKDSKEKDKERARSPEPAEKSAEGRGRFNSLDSRVLLSNSTYTEQPKSAVEQLCVPTPTSATAAPSGAAAVGSGKDSVALRAMRSVRSLARIGSWAQLRNTPNPEAVVAPAKDKDPDAKKKKKKDKEKEKAMAKQTYRHSGSSFEVGALSPPTSKHDQRSLGKKKGSILGLGLPSTMRLPSSRSGSTASSIVAANTVNNRLSVDSAAVLGGGILARGRSGSTMSTASSLRPMSASSCVSGSSSGSSAAASVQWDEAGLETVKETRRKDKEARRKEREEKEKKKKKSTKSKSGKESSRKSSDTRRRTPLASIFSDTLSEREEEGPVEQLVTPIVTIEEATLDGDKMVRDESPMETPVRLVRSRPLSEQLVGRDRPRPFYEGDDDNAVMSLLDAATNDLAQLINRLDLEATPGSMDVTPMSSQFSLDRHTNSPDRRAVTESPVRGMRIKTSSMTSLRPYAQTCSFITGKYLGQNIAPWSTLNAGISPSKPSPSSIRTRSDDNTATLRRVQRLSPAPPADPSPVFKALRPAITRFPISKTVVGHSGISPFAVNAVDRSPSSLTFGSGHSKSESHGSSLAPSPVFKKAQGHTRKRSCLVSEKTNQDSPSLPIPPEARRSLGLAGTMGGSIGSNAEREYDASDPDSDIPDELQVLLSNPDQEVEDTMTFDAEPVRTPLPSPGLPPKIPLPELDSPSPRTSVANTPVFRSSVVEEDFQLDAEEIGGASEDDTKKSFDFTGELKRLNESGVSDRRSFIEQLENAFRTPAKIDLRYDFQNFSSADVPPVPELPTLHAELSRVGESSFNLPIHYESHILASPTGLPVDVNNLEPSLLPGRDSFATTASDDELLKILAPLRNITTVGSRPSDGELNRDFKFGGRNSPESNKEAVPLTLSDIIPPPEVAQSLSRASLAGDESALMKSIFAHAIDIPSPPVRPRLDSTTSSKRRTREIARRSLIAGHRRDSSMLSFAGFDSFAEIRRGFEFNDSRPGWYPPPGATSSRRHARDESILSFVSVSSYGHVLNAGSADPFDYASLASLRGRPVSDQLSVSMSTTVDDTFSFIRRQPRRRRVDSDASSFYCRLSQIHPYNRHHRRRESSVSFISPPASLYNRSFGAHRRGDSSTSISSVVQSYAMGGASGGRNSWVARHRANFSIDSTLSDFTGTNLGRPGLGDKMLESALDHGMPLAAISASPPASLSGSIRGIRNLSDEDDSRSSYDSIMDTRDGPQKTLPEDSLFDKTGHRTTTTSDSAFFEQRLGAPHDELKPPRYRPISSLSIASVHSPAKEDDTMISMLGGGHVRRRSVTSMIGSSPCIRVERRKNIIANPPETVFSRIKNAQEDRASPEKSRVIESKPSIASTTSSTEFGDERMIRARHGLLERQSLENTVLVAEGEDLSSSFRLPVFTRPSRVTRSRSSTCTSASGADTPPLSISDGYSSFSEASQSSIDLSQLNHLLSNLSHPSSNAVFDRVRPPTRGHGHRRRISQARASRSSIYETIQEEFTSSLSPLNSPTHSAPGSATKTMKVTEEASSSMISPQVFVVDPEISSVESFSLWDDERGITALRKYYALRDEAQDTITESKRAWLDTSFSLFALQSFDPPRHPSGMRAMLEHSRQNYGPLSSELRPHRTRSRVNSRPSPYPRTIKTSFTSTSPPDQLRAESPQSTPPEARALSVPLQQVMVDPNVPSTLSTLQGKVSGPKGSAVELGKPDRTIGLAALSNVGLNARRPASGLTKKSTGRSGFGNKENNTSMANKSVGAGIGNVSQASGLTPSDGLRLSRPRPRGRPTPASSRPVRV